MLGVLKTMYDIVLDVKGPYEWSPHVFQAPAGGPKAKDGHPCLPSPCGGPADSIDDGDHPSVMAAST